MKKLISFISVVLFSVSANATLISIELDKATYEVGETITAEVVAKGSAAFGFGNLIGSFELDILSDDALVSHTGTTFGDKLNMGDPLFWIFGYQNESSTPGKLELNELSDLFEFDLVPLQSGLSEFTLATITFTADKAGSGAFSFINSVVGDALGTPLLAQFQDARFTIENKSVVPEPSTLALFSALGFLLLRRKVK